jgi:hypothetical protein
MDWLKENVPALHGAISGAADKVSQVATSVVPGSTDAKVSNFVGAPADARGAGYTMTGGRRRGKSRRGNKKARKTRRRY